jgi:dynein heavy chain
MEGMRKMFEPFSTMWRFCSEFMRSLPEWMDGPFPEIDPELVASECDKWWRGTAKLAKILSGEPLQVVQQVRHRAESLFP